MQFNSVQQKECSANEKSTCTKMRKTVKNIKLQQMCSARDLTSYRQLQCWFQLYSDCHQRPKMHTHQLLLHDNINYLNYYLNYLKCRIHNIYCNYIVLDITLWHKLIIKKMMFTCRLSHPTDWNNGCKLDKRNRNNAHTDLNSKQLESANQISLARIY